MDNKKYIFSRFFAAVNSFDGFKSYFADKFAPLEYERIFILKGGPGTGKSTLMRKMAEKCRENGLDTNEIYCSSDVKSLDGIIASSGNKKISVIDGTSPHMADPVYPGCIETIVDLAGGFNMKALRDQRKEITELNLAKKSAYKMAYEYLSYAKEYYSEVKDILKNSTIYSLAESNLSLMFKNIESVYKSTAGEELILMSAFGKDGYYRMNSEGSFVEKHNNITYISGDGIIEFVLMNILYRHAHCHGTVSKYGHSPLTTEDCDFFVCGESVFMTADKKCDRALNASSLLSYLGDDYFEAKEMYDLYLEKARNAFSEASKYHFELEKIYSRNMNFAFADAYERNMIDEISTILGI